MSDDRLSSDQDMEDTLRMVRESSEFYENLANALDALAKRMLSGKAPEGIMHGEGVFGAVADARLASPDAGVSPVEHAAGGR